MPDLTYFLLYIGWGQVGIFSVLEEHDPPTESAWLCPCNGLRKYRNVTVYCISQLGAMTVTVLKTEGLLEQMFYHS